MGTDHLAGKRGKKGGTQFPRYSLKHLVSFLGTLMGKTHTSAINIEQLNAGVFNVSANSPKGKVKFSALKQFGLVEGDYKAINSTQLCSDIEMNDGESRIAALQRALKKVKPFEDALVTFQNSSIETVKIGQYASSTLKVHPDLREEFSKVFIESCETAQLCSIDGSTISFIQNPATIAEEENGSDDEVDENGLDENTVDTDLDPEDDNESPRTFKKKQGNSNINVSIDVDPSMDPEKLEKLLKLLKNYGAI